MVSWGEPMAPYSDHLPALLAPHLAVLWSVSVSNQGVSGELTEEIKDRAPYKTKWDVAVILGGTNDLGDVDVDAIWDNLRDMYTKFEAAQAVVVAVTVPNVCMVCRVSQSIIVECAARWLGRDLCCVLCACAVCAVSCVRVLCAVCCVRAACFKLRKLTICKLFICFH